MTSVCSWLAPLACLVIRKPLRFRPRARNRAKTRQGPSFAQQKFFAPCLKSLVLSERGGAKERRRRTSSAWGGLRNELRNGGLAYLLGARIRAEGGWTGRGNQSDCLHDEDLVSSAIATGGVDSRACKVALRACGSMPTRQHNQRRSPLLHRLAHEHKGAWHH